MKILNILSFSLIFAANLLAETSVNWEVIPKEMEINKKDPISIRIISDLDDFPMINWSVDNGEIQESNVIGEIIFISPESACTTTLKATINIAGKVIVETKEIKILPLGSLKKTADVLIEVDTSILKNVWVDESHPNENFTAPLKIKGTFRYDPETDLAFAGGSWPTYEMFDDGTHGDKIANDEIWSIKMSYPKSDTGVYIAFDDNSEYRIEFESGIMWRVKMAFIELDEFPDDHSNIKFVPDEDKTISWTLELAKEGGIYEAN